MNARIGWLLLACAIWPAQFAAAQFVDLETAVEVSEWNPNGVRTWTTPMHLVVGTNSWFMDGFYNGDTKVTYRFTGTNIVENTIFPSTHTTRLIDTADGNPGRPVRQLDGLMLVARIGWLAFCSGPCLKREGRRIFPPSDLWKELVAAHSFADRTSVFEDAFGLPKSMDLSTTNGQIVMQYRVAGSTIISGWEFPLEFYLAQYRPAPVPESQSMTAGTEGWELQFVAKGTVKAIEPRAEMPNPETASSSAPPEGSSTSAPTGTYLTASPVQLTLKLRPDGTYEVRAERGVQEGTWEWNSQQREFGLKPTAGKFPFDLRRLRADRDDPQCLQWIPALPANPGAGAIDYVRFKAQKAPS